jgi:hypothetical protein
MSRYHKVPPNGHYIVLAGGYRLCARCGNIQCTDETAQVVYRNPAWGIYTHVKGPNCPEKSVPGWRAVELAMDMCATNVPTPREANAVSIGGFDFHFVSLLDDEHCHAEMDAVTISQRDFLPAPTHAVSRDGSVRAELLEGWTDCRHRREWWYREAKIVEALDLGIYGALAKIARHVLKHERLALYTNGSGRWYAVSRSEEDQRPMCAMDSFSARSRILTAQNKSRAPQRRSHGFRSTFPHDVLGKPGEYPLYSQQQLTDGRRVLKFGGEELDEFTYYRLSEPGSELPSLPFNSASSPEMFDWCNDVPTALVEHWKGNPKSAPYGPVARLKPAILASLRIRTQTQAQAQV